MDHHPAEVLVDASLEEQDWGMLSRFASFLLFFFCSAVASMGQESLRKSYRIPSLNKVFIATERCTARNGDAVVRRYIRNLSCLSVVLYECKSLAIDVIS